MQILHQAQSFLDRSAVALSGLCLVHCVVVALAIVVAPLLGIGLISHGIWHEILLALALPISIAALYLGYRRHGDGRIALWAASGLALMALGVAQSEIMIETLLTIPGVLILARAHILNWQRQRESVWSA